MGEGVWRWGKREIIYLLLYCHHQDDSCIKIGSDFNVLLIVRDKATKTVSTNHNPFEEKGEPKRNRVEALLLTSLTPYRWARPAHVEEDKAGRRLRRVPNRCSAIVVTAPGFTVRHVARAEKCRED